MKVQEWQNKFLNAIQSKQYMVYPVGMVKALMNPNVTDVEEFKRKAKLYFVAHRHLEFPNADGQKYTPRTLAMLIDAIEAEIEEAVIVEQVFEAQKSEEKPVEIVIQKPQEGKKYTKLQAK